LQAWGGWRCCGLRDSADSVTSQALGRHGDDGIAGSRRTMALRGQGRRGSMMSQARERRLVHSVMGSWRTMLLQAWEWRCWLGDSAYVVDDITSMGRGRWRRIKGSTVVGNNSTEAPWRSQWWHGGSREDSMMAQDSGRSTMAQAPRKFLAGIFDSLTAWVKASGD
jgi:hypothetical protein